MRSVRSQMAVWLKYRSHHVRNENKGVSYDRQFQRIRAELAAEPPSGWTVLSEMPRPLTVVFPHRGLY